MSGRCNIFQQKAAGHSWSRGKHSYLLIIKQKYWQGNSEFFKLLLFLFQAPKGLSVLLHLLTFIWTPCLGGDRKWIEAFSLDTLIFYQVSGNLMFFRFCWKHRHICWKSANFQLLSLWFYFANFRHVFVVLYQGQVTVLAVCLPGLLGC